MRSARLLICLLLLAAVLVDLAALLMVRAAGGADLKWPHPLLAGLFSLAFSQVNLVTVWAAMSRSALPWRLAALVVVVTLWSVALTAVVTEPLTGYATDDWTLLLLGQSAVLLVPLSCFRVRGGRLAHVDQVEPVETKRRLQFSVGYLLAWITATAITLGMLRWTVSFELLVADGWYGWLGMIIVSVSNAALGLATVCGVLGTQRMVVGALAFCLGAAVASITAIYLANPREFLLALALLWLLLVFWLVAALSVLRVAGFRFQSRG